MFVRYEVLNHWTYLTGAVFTALVPGPNTLFIPENSISSGMRGGCLTVYGVFTGDAVLMFLAWAGVVALIKTTPILFNTVHYPGAFYLLYLGSKIFYATLKDKNSEAKSDEPQYSTVFKCVLVLSLTNPKAILFYVSFFVQFIDANAPHTGISFSILATTLELASSYYLNFLIISGAFVTQYIYTKRRLAEVGDSLIGLVFVGFAARLATLQS